MMSGAWSKNPVWESSLTGVSEIDSPDLSAYQELSIRIKSIRHNTATTAALYLQLSEDGSTWINSGYVGVGLTSAEGFMFVDALPVATLASGYIELMNFNVPRVTWATIRGGRDGVGGGARMNSGYHPSEVVWRYIRITNIATPGPSPSPFDANGGISVFVRQP